MILRARIVLPLSQPPIEDGAVAIAGERIVAVGRWSELAASAHGEVRDLGETVLLPGLINAHCHLDYTDMAGQIPPTKRFSDWIKAMVALKGVWSDAEFAQCWRHGAAMLLRTGTTTVLNVEAVPELLPDLWKATPLRVISFREMIRLKGGAAISEEVEAAASAWAAMPGAGDRVGLSPHAPYSTTPELLRFAARAAGERGWRLTTHLAESEEEFDMFMYRRGPLYDWLQTQRESSDCGQGSPVRHLERCGCLSERMLAVHANYLWGDDVATLARRKVNVVHCPRSHAYFGHRRFPYAELAAAGVNICLGTDSLVTVLKIGKQLPELDLFSEMQNLATQRPEIGAAAILRMATLGGAVALGRVGELGEIAPKAFADLIVLPFAGRVSEVEEAVVHRAGVVAGSMINGHWVVSPPTLS